MRIQMYSEIEMDAMTYKAQADMLKENLEDLQVRYEELQDLFVSTDEELNIYRGRFVDEAIQNSSLKLDYDLLRGDMTTVLHRLSMLEQVEHRLSLLEKIISNANQSNA